MYLEYINQDQDLRAEVEVVRQIQPETDPNKTLAMMGKALRAILSKWKTRVTADFSGELKEVIDLTVLPTAPGQMPDLPNPDAFDSNDHMQMDEYKERVEVVFERLKAWTGRKLAHEYASPEELDPHHRFMDAMQRIDGLISWLTPAPQKTVQMPSGEKLVLVDDGTWPGHKVGLVKEIIQDYNKAKYLSGLNYSANQAGFKAHAEIPVDLPKKVESPEPPPTREQMVSRMMGKKKENLIKFAKKECEGLELNDSMTKPEIIDEILNYDSQGIT